MTKTTKTTTAKKSYAPLTIAKKENKKNTVYTAGTTRLFDVYTSKKNAIIYVHQNVDQCVNSQHKNVMGALLEKYAATPNKNFSDSDKFKYRVAVSVDTLDAFVADLSKACAFIVSEAPAEAPKAPAKRAKKAPAKKTASDEPATATETEKGGN